MKNKLIFSVISVLLIFTAIIQLSAETVYIDELQKASDAGDIIFENYSGPHKQIDTIDEIRGIGRYLGRNIERLPVEFSFFGKYRVIHAVDFSTTDGLDADIFILEKTASVDHVSNLRRIIAGYLEAAYGYEAEQSDLLAEFITIYNAVHRNDLEYFNGIYKKTVTKHLINGKTGLALSYLEWPGNTMMVIPLTPQAGEDVISDLSTDILSDEDVLNQMRTQDDMGIDSRQDLVKLKDDEVLEEMAAIEEEKEKIDKRGAELAVTKEDLKDEAAQLEDKKTDAAEDRVDEIKAEITEIENEENKLADDAAKIAEREQKVEVREEAIVEERKKIAEDQMKQIAGEEKAQATDAAPKAVKAAAPDTVPFLKLIGDSGNYTGQLLLIDTANGEIIERSSIDTIRLRGYRYSGAEIISVAGSTGGTRIVSLVRIDPGTLEVIDSGTAAVYFDSAVIESSGSYYAVVDDGGKWKIGRFDNELKLESVSDVEVFPATDIVIQKKNVIAQDSAGRVIKITTDDFKSPAF